MRLFFRFRDWQGRYPLHCRRLGFTDPDPARDEDKANHTGMVRYGNEPLTLWAACPGMQKPESLATSILAVDWIGRTHRGTRPRSG
ncbi:MAG TPA: hypothetical protein VNO21_18910 [Polyangiaceae bacterium]|nr:hypothetical protein [Polyangiaceae bacterium]